MPPKLRFSTLVPLLALAALGLSPAAPIGGQSITPTPPPGPTPVAFKPEEDPNAPGLSRAERIRRQEIYIRNKLAQNRQAQAADKKAALEEQARQERGEGTNRPNNPPPANAAQTLEPGATPPPGAAPDKNQHIVYKIVAKEKNVLEDDPWGFKKMTLYMHPASVVTQSGTTFSTVCRLANMDRVAPDRVELVVHYPKEYVEPVSVHYDAIREKTLGHPSLGLVAERGEVRFQAQLTAPLDAIDTPLIEIVWRALAPAEGLSIALRSPDHVSKAWSGGKLLTGNEFGPEGVVVGTSLRIVPPKPAVPGGERLIVGAALEEYAPALAPLGSLDDPPPVLWLDYERRERYQPGQWIVADVVLTNESSSPFDDLRLALKFDPEVLEISDTDERNWIRSGPNILDGLFREVWRWDKHGENRVDNTTGVISYHMGRVDFRRQPSGTVARIFARVKKPASEPLFDWMLNPGEENLKPTTGVYLLGVNLLERHAERNAPAEMILVGQRTDSDVLPEKADPSLYRERRRTQ